MSGKYEPMELTGGQALVAQLLEEGVADIFGIPGIQLDWAVDAIRSQPDRIRYIMPRHEQATSYMADGYARTTGREGVFMVVPGPGVLNALSGLATAYACSSRVLCISGQIPSTLIGQKHGMLHEIPDQSGILKSLTKWHGIAHRPEDVPALVHEAFVQLRSGHPRPVAIELPPDVLQAKGVTTILQRAEFNRLEPQADAVKAAATMLAQAKFPVIQVGGGAAASGAGKAIQALAERLQAPVVMTDGARGLLDDNHPLALTSLGGRAVFPHADVIVAVGTRFIDGIARPTHASGDTKYVYVNVDAGAAGAPRAPGCLVLSDATAAAEALLEALPSDARASSTEKIGKVKAWSASQTDAIQPQTDYVRAIRSSMADDDILVSELTQVGYFSNIAFPVHAANSYVTPGYQGTLGYGFNTALGAAHGNPDRRVVSLNGDGGFGWGMQELATLARDGCNMSVVVFVDGHYGNVRRIQQRTFGDTFAVELANPDFAHLASAFGLPFEKVDSPSGLHAALTRAKDSKGPALIAVSVSEMPSPWALIHPFVPSPVTPPANPLG
ncbi:thiamine pyrophosphate-binding protein [Aminobacter carboxidus]